jgi:hypothetical protein
VLEKTMFRWTLRQMFVGSLIVALIVPYFRVLLPDRDPPLKEFTLTDPELRQWLAEADPQLDFDGSTQSVYSLHYSEGDVTLKGSDLPAQQIFNQIESHLKAKIQSEAWRIATAQKTSDSLMFEFSDGHSKRYFYIWLKQSQPATFKLLSIRYPSY